MKSYRYMTVLYLVLFGVLNVFFQLDFWLGSLSYIHILPNHLSSEMSAADYVRLLNRYRIS